MTNKKTTKNDLKQEVNEDVKDADIDYKNMTCGYVMPITNIVNYQSNHWSDVLSILDEVCEDIGFKTYKLVSNTLESNVIHASIVNNLFNDEIVICDVSSKNPNVMFELGMRIAFDKPVIIIKDDSTDYCFDTGTIEHINYPKELRYEDIKTFKIKLKNKIIATLKTKHEFPDKSPILERFGLVVSSASLANLPNMEPSDIARADILGAISALNRKVDLLVNKKTYNSDIFEQKIEDINSYVYELSIQISEITKLLKDNKYNTLSDPITFFRNKFLSGYDVKIFNSNLENQSLIIKFKYKSDRDLLIKILRQNSISASRNVLFSGSSELA